MVLLNPGTFLINVDVHPFPQEIFKKTSQTPNTSSALGRCSATNFKSSWNAVRKPADGWSVFLLLQTAGGALKKYNIYIYIVYIPTVDTQIQDPFKKIHQKRPNKFGKEPGGWMPPCFREGTIDLVCVGLLYLRQGLEDQLKSIFGEEQVLRSKIVGTWIVGIQ